MEEKKHVTLTKHFFCCWEKNGIWQPWVVQIQGAANIFLKNWKARVLVYTKTKRQAEKSVSTKKNISLAKIMGNIGKGRRVHSHTGTIHHTYTIPILCVMCMLCVLCVLCVMCYALLFLRFCMKAVWHVFETSFLYFAFFHWNIYIDNHIIPHKAGDPASSNELFRRSPQYYNTSY